MQWACRLSCVKLTTTRLYCFINGKIKKKPEKPWIRHNCSKNRQFHVFLQQAANSMANREFCGISWKSTCRRVLLALLFILYFINSFLYFHHSVFHCIYSFTQFTCEDINAHHTWHFLLANTRFVIRPNGRPNWTTSPSVASSGKPPMNTTRRGVRWESNFDYKNQCNLQSVKTLHMCAET